MWLLLDYPANLQSGLQIHYMLIKHHYHSVMNLLHKKKPVRKLKLLTKSLVTLYLCVCVCVCVCVGFCGFQLDKFYWHIFLLFSFVPRSFTRRGKLFLPSLPVSDRTPPKGRIIPPLEGDGATHRGRVLSSSPLFYHISNFMKSVFLDTKTKNAITWHFEFWSEWRGCIFPLSSFVGPFHFAALRPEPVFVSQKTISNLITTAKLKMP